jgi:hypothetical protein
MDLSETVGEGVWGLFMCLVIGAGFCDYDNGPY